MSRHFLRVLFPPKCVLCGSLLTEQETDLCRSCRLDAPVFTKSKIRFSFIAGWTAVWYYKDYVRKSLLRYKFSNRRSYAGTYGRMLAMKLQTEDMDRFDMLTWVPTGALRKWKRGYDQVELLAKAVALELGTEAVPLLKKVKNTPPQSRISHTAGRRANVMNAYKVENPETVSGKNILLLDDIITTGSTVSECAKTLLIAGANQVQAAAIAAAVHDNSKKTCR